MFNKNNNMLLATVLKALAADYCMTQFANKEEFEATLFVHDIHPATFKAWCRAQHFPNPGNVKRLAEMFRIEADFLNDVHAQGDGFKATLEALDRYKRNATKRVNKKTIDLVKDLNQYYVSKYDTELFHNTDFSFEVDSTHIK